MNYIEIVYAFFATFFFAIIFSLRGEKLFFSSLCGALGWYALIVTQNLKYSKVASFFIAAITITIVSELVAKKLKTPVTTTLIPALIPLVPGGGIYYTMYYMVTNEFLAARVKGMETISITVALSVGIFLVSTFFQIFNKLFRYLTVLKKYNIEYLNKSLKKNNRLL